MINLSDGELLDLLPAQFKNDVDMICLSYAIKMVTQELLEYSKRSMTRHYIDILPESILDAIAVELRGPYYRQNMSIEVKRDIIKNALIWYTKAGTPAAIEEMIEKIFGEGEVIEWFDFTEGDNTPGLFDIVTNAQMTEDIVEVFMGIIERVKNARSHLRRVLIHRTMGMKEYEGSGVITSPRIPVTNNKNSNDAASMTETVAGGAVSDPHITFINVRTGASESIHRNDAAAASIITSPKNIIGNNYSGSGSFNTDIRIAIGAVSGPKISIGNNIATAHSVPAHNYACLAAWSMPLIRINNAASD